MRRLPLLIALTLAGCGGAEERAAAPPAEERDAQAPAAAPLTPARCPGPDSDACTAHTGRVIAIESVDPDGDGDLHVIATGGSVTAPGVTIFDVDRALRPARDPRPGDRVTGAGPVFRGSLRQRQIEVTSFRVARSAAR